MDDQNRNRWYQRNGELYTTAVGRALWQSVRGDRRGPAGLSPEAQALGPYETAYDVKRGYGYDRSEPLS